MNMDNLANIFAVDDMYDEGENCLYDYYRSSGYKNLCVGSPCAYNNNCNSGCCSGGLGYCQYDSWCDDYVNLAWLWWTLASVCLILCIVSMIVGAKRRRRQMELAHAIHEAHHADPCNNGQNPQVVYVQQQPGMMQPGQQVQYQQVPQGYPMQQQQQMQQPQYVQQPPQAQNIDTPAQ